MSKTKQKERSEVEYLRGKVKKLESTNRRLRKELRSLKKRAHMYEDIVEDVATSVEESKDICTECGKGEITVHDFVHIIVKSCDTCGHKKKIKPRRKK